MSELTHVHRTADGIAEIDVVGNGFLGGRTAVTMTGEHELVVVADIIEHPEETVPMGSAQQDDVVRIHLADGSYTTFVERLQQGVERILVLEIMGNGLVHQLIA